MTEFDKYKNKIDRLQSKNDMSIKELNKIERDINARDKRIGEIKKEMGYRLNPFKVNTIVEIETFTKGMARWGSVIPDDSVIGKKIRIFANWVYHIYDGMGAWGRQEWSYVQEEDVLKAKVQPKLLFMADGICNNIHYAILQNMDGKVSCYEDYKTPDKEYAKSMLEDIEERVKFEEEKYGNKTTNK